MPKRPKLLYGLGLFLALFSSSGMLLAQSNPSFELVVNLPTETTLHQSNLKDATAVWQTLFNHAKTEINIAQFYVYSQPNSELDTVLQSLHRAGERGVKIRFLLDQAGTRLSNPETIKQLQAIPNLELRIMNFSKLSQGIIHAKYLSVDGREAFVGSQNFDWRALKHIHETGLKIQDSTMVQHINQIFEADWHNQQRVEQQQAPLSYQQHPQLDNVRHGDYVLASPPQFTPSNISTAVDSFSALIASAQSEINIQVMQYAPLYYRAGKREFYGFIDNSLRAAAARGVKVNLMIADWNIKYPDIDWIKSLALIPNIQIKIVTIPKSKDGFIPFARVIHSKYMTIDHQTAWVGTSNWSGGYFEQSRNLDIVLNDHLDITQQLDRQYAELWNSDYAKPIDIHTPYRVVNPAKE